MANLPPHDGPNDMSLLNFHQHFRQQIQVLQDEIVLLDGDSLSATQRKGISDGVITRVANLTTELADVSGNIPAYDQRSYSQALKTLQEGLAIAQARYAPKSKFSFKNKRLAAASLGASSKLSSRSVMPMHPRGLEDDEVRAAPAIAVPSSHGTTHTVGPGQISATNNDRLADEPTNSSKEQDESVRASTTKNAYLQLAPTTDMASTDQLQQAYIFQNVSSSVINLTTRAADPAPPFLTLNNIQESIIVAPCINGPVHMTGLRRCTLVLSCHQFRMHDSHDVDVYLFCSSRPIIENCSGIKFASIPEVFSHEAETGTNSFAQVDDFKWLRATASPNWSLMAEGEILPDRIWNEMTATLDGDIEDTRESTGIALVRDILFKVGLGSQTLP